MRNILVTGTGGKGCGVSIVQALSRAGSVEGSFWVRRWRIIAGDMNPFSWGLYSQWAGVLLPGPDDPGYLSRVQEVIDEHDIAAVIPGTEPEAALLAENRDKLRVPVIANKAGLMPLMMDKFEAENRLWQLNLPCTPSYPWELRANAVRAHRFPLVIKPQMNSGGSKGLFLVTSQEELDALEPFLSPHSMVQPYIGDDKNEYTVGVLSRKDGSVIGSIVIRRELTGLSLHTRKDEYAVSTGFTQGYVVRHPQIQEFCEDLAAKLGSQGPLNIQLRLHKGTPYVFEIHPRFSASTGIRASAGFNEPDIMLRHFLDGEDFSQKISYRDNVAAIRYLDHILVDTDLMLHD